MCVKYCLKSQDTFSSHMKQILRNVEGVAAPLFSDYERFPKARNLCNASVPESIRV